MSLLVNDVEVFIQTSFGKQGSICTPAVILNKIKVKVSVFTYFVVGLLGNFKHRIILFATKLIFDAIFSNILFHNHIPFVIYAFS